MDYLKSFVIGTSGLITFQYFAPLYLVKDKTKEFPFHEYSIVAPIWFGLLSVLALLLGKTFNISLSMRLFIISIISVTIISSFNYFYSKDKLQPYKNFTNKEWLYFILRNGSRHIIAFNLIMFYFEKYFSLLKVFIVGSSAFSYMFTYLKIMMLDKQNKLNYDYRLFATMEPILQGLLLVVGLKILMDGFKLNLKNSLIVLHSYIPIFWFIGAKYIFKTYNYTNDEWMVAIGRIYITLIVKYFVFYYLLTKLK